MSGNNITISMPGLANVIRTFDALAGNAVLNDIDRISETYARKMAEESAAMAPVDTASLRNSIASSPQESTVEHVWEYGSNLPYAIKMEYTHPTNRAFIRKTVWDNREKYRRAIKERILRS